MPLARTDEHTTRVRLPQGAEAYGDVIKLEASVGGFLYECLDLEIEWRALITAYVISTWFPEKLLHMDAQVESRSCEAQRRAKAGAWRADLRGFLRAGSESYKKQGAEFLHRFIGRGQQGNPPYQVQDHKTAGAQS